MCPQDTLCSPRQPFQTDVSAKHTSSPFLSVGSAKLVLETHRGVFFSQWPNARTQAHKHTPTHACMHSRKHVCTLLLMLVRCSHACSHTRTRIRGCQAGHPAPHSNSRLSFLPLAFCTKRDAFALVIKAESPASPCACASQPGQKKGGQKAIMG